MTAEPTVERALAMPRHSSRLAVRRKAKAFVRQFRSRLSDRRFWVTQALVLTISVAHSLLEATHHLGALPDLALLPVSTYFIPVVYAALNFGVEGAVPTALWCSFLTIPNLVFWHSGAQRPGVVLQLTLLVALAYVIARRVDIETAAKERTEAANQRLERLNRTAAASAQSLDLESVLSQTARSMLAGRKEQTSWIALGPAAIGGEFVVAASTGGPAEVGERELLLGRSFITRAAAEDRVQTICIRESHIALVPLRLAGSTVGAVGLKSAAEPLSEDELMLLEAVGNQLGVSVGNISHFRKSQSMVAELSRAQQRLQDYVRLATEAQEDERKRLARELHDDTIQALVIAKTELEPLAQVQPLSAEVEERLRKIDRTLSEAIENVRRFTRDLRPSLLDDLGLVHAIDWLVEDVRARTGLDARLSIRGEARRLDQKDELALFRIVQEALRNAERHAEPEHVRVDLEFGDRVSATVSDDGCGFHPAEALDQRASPSGLGLLGMRERAKIADAAFSVTSRPGEGTRVEVTLDASVDDARSRTAAG